MRNATIDGRCRSVCAFCTVLLALALTATSAGFARQKDGEAANNGFSYQAYSETEITTALQKPLRLDDCIRIALRKNISLRIVEGDLAQAEATHAGTYGKFLPVFSLRSTKRNVFTMEDTAKAAAVSPFVETDFNNSTAILGQAQIYTPTGATLEFVRDFSRNANFPLEQPIRKSSARTYDIIFTQPLLRGAGPKVARGALLGTGYDRQIQEKQLFEAKLQAVFAVKRAYYDALSSRELIKVNETALRNDSMLVEASQALIVAKMASRRDVLSAQIRLADDKAAVFTSRNDYQFALDKLKDLMGIPIEAPIDLDSTSLRYTPVQLEEAAMVRQAIENSPDIQSAKAAIDKNKLQLSLAKNALLPQLDLRASYSSNTNRNLVLNKDLSKEGNWEASLNLSYNFLSREASADVENARIALSQQEDRLVDLQRQIMVDVRNVVRNVYSAAEEIQAIQGGIQSAEEKLAFATAMFNLGRASNFDITDAQEFVVKAQSQYLRKLVDFHTQLALLESLTGRPVTP